MTKTITATLLFAAAASAQSQPEREAKLKAEAANLMILMPANFPESTVAGAPYSADETTTTTQTLLDGNRIVNTSATKVYRDQQGRTRVERTLAGIGSMAAGQPSMSVTINDPVAHTRYTLDTEAKVAHKNTSNDAMKFQFKQILDEQVKTKVRAEANSFSFNYSSSSAMADRKNAKVEELGVSNMAGVPVKGTRFTTVIPAGTIGNDRDIVISEERWYSPDLQMNIMTRRSDPRMGETVFQVNNLSRSNPDPFLFQLPPDYQVTDVSTTLKTVTRE